MEKNSIPTLTEIKAAAEKIKPFAHNTPVFTSEIINNKLGGSFYFKCENMQKAGAFKFRGATNALQNLGNISPEISVVTHSSGNHAGALAKASAMLGRKCIVVMPKNAPKVKVDAVKSYGAEIVFCVPTLEARETTTESIIDKTGAILIHPYNNFYIIAGQGTAALELHETINDLDCIITPVGGGGLLSGTAIATKELKPSVKVYAGEPKGADDAYRSLKAKKLIPQTNPNTIADGLLTSLGELTFKAITKYVDDIFTVSEESIVEAMKLVWQHMKIIIEPSSAVPLAAIMENKEVFAGKKTGVIISGGNVDLSNLPF
jgi:threonine dehydratase